MNPYVYVSVMSDPSEGEIHVYFFDGARRADLRTHEAVIEAINEALKTRDVKFSHSAQTDLGLPFDHYKKGQTIT